MKARRARARKKKGKEHQLTSGDLDTLGLKVLGVAGRHGAPLAELLELIDLKRRREERRRSKERGSGGGGEGRGGE